MDQSVVDITDFDSVSACEDAFPVMLKNADGITDSGVTLMVIGRHADAVSKWLASIYNKAMREQHIAAKRGKQPEAKSLDDLREQNIEGACVRVVGWKGVKQAYSKDLLVSALRRNPHWIDQIVEESDSMGNFTSSAPKS